MAYIIYNDKKVWYKIRGKGSPLLLLHGNTASSRMFNGLIRMYAKHYMLIIPDFPGHGKSERLETFETDFWFYNAQVCKALLDHLSIEKVAVIGTSGGALVGINLSLEYPEKVRHLVADSFEGEYPLESYIKNLISDREKDKKKFLAKLFWFYMHGFDWKKIVDADTKINIDFYKLNRSFFHKPIRKLQVSTMLTGSKQDEYCDSLNQIYPELKKKNDLMHIHLFETGKHPAMISNKKDFFNLIKTSI